MNLFDFYSTTCQKLLHFAIEQKKNNPLLDLETREEWKEMFDKYEAPAGPPDLDDGNAVLSDVMAYISEGRMF